MTGRYQMVSESGEQFEIDVPTFSLDSPSAETRVELPRPLRGGIAPSMQRRSHRDSSS